MLGNGELHVLGVRQGDENHFYRWLKISEFVKKSLETHQRLIYNIKWVQKIKLHNLRQYKSNIFRMQYLELYLLKNLTSLWVYKLLGIHTLDLHYWKISAHSPLVCIEFRSNFVVRNYFCYFSLVNYYLRDLLKFWNYYFSRFRLWYCLLRFWRTAPTWVF